MNQELIEAEQLAAQSDIPFIEPKMYLVHRTNEERGRYNDPVNTSEMAVVFTGADGVPPEGNRIRIYPNDGPLREISDCNANRDPMLPRTRYYFHEENWVKFFKKTILIVIFVISQQQKKNAQNTCSNKKNIQKVLKIIFLQKYFFGEFYAFNLNATNG